MTRTGGRRARWSCEGPCFPTLEYGDQIVDVPGRAMFAALHRLGTADQIGALFGVDQPGPVALGPEFECQQRDRQLIPVVEHVVDEDDPLILQDFVIGRWKSVIMPLGQRAWNRSLPPTRKSKSRFRVSISEGALNQALLASRLP